MSYIILIIVVVAIVIITFIAGRIGKNGKNGDRTSFPKSIRGLIGMNRSKLDAIIEDINKHKDDVLEVIREETNRQNQISGENRHLGEDIRGVTEHTIEKKLDISGRLVELCLKELEREDKIRKMKLSGATVHYVLAAQ
ncbi:hypothetical protein HON59_01930 [bacterium]|nr:hypothetical protein [bacterium]